MYVIECYKFNYSNGLKTPRQLWIIGNELFYTNNHSLTKKTQLNKIEIDNITNIIYGTRSNTFNIVKKCIPWRCISFITNSETYDFEIHNFNNIMAIIRLFSNFKHIKLPLIRQIINFKEWLVKKGKLTSQIGYMCLYDKYKANELINIENENKDCPICWDKITDDYIILDCSHIYHTDCINQWLIKKDTCPYCRNQISI